MKYGNLEQAVFDGGLADAFRYVLESGNPDELFSSRQGELIGLIHILAMCGEKTGIDILLDKGANIELKTSKNNTALIWAVQAKNEELTEFLLEKGANANVHGEWDETPLHIAVNDRNQKIAQILLDYNANLDERNEMGISVRQLMLHMNFLSSVL